MKRLGELLEYLKYMAQKYLLIDKARLAILKKPLFWMWFLLHICIIAILFHSFVASLFSNLFSIFIALIPATERISLYIDNVRRLATSTEKEVLPLFEEVKMTCGACPCELKIIDSLEINAFSSPRNVIITRGILQTFPNDELAGVLAHELAHIQNGDANLQAILTAYYNMTFLNMTIICIVINSLARLFSGNILGSILDFMYKLIRGIYNILVYIGCLIINMGRRRQEYGADQQSWK